MQVNTAPLGRNKTSPEIRKRETNPNRNAEARAFGFLFGRLVRQSALVEVQRPHGSVGGMWVMRDHNDRFAMFPIQALEKIKNLVSGLAIQITGWFVA